MRGGLLFTLDLFRNALPVLLSILLTAVSPFASAKSSCRSLINGDIRAPRLTRAEVEVIREYVTLYNHEINQMLRERTSWDECPSCETFYHSLIGTLRKMPSHIGTVYRGARLSPRSELRQAIEEGRTSYIERAFLSTSLDSSVAQRFAGEGDRSFLFVIQGKTGRSIHQIVDGTQDASGKKISEKEVLFLPGTQFLIRNVDRSNEITIVELEEAS